MSICPVEAGSFPTREHSHPKWEERARAARQAEEIAEAAARRISSKFVAGQAEHGGNLFRKPVVEEAIHEAVDLFTYLFVLERQQQQALSLLDDWLSFHDCPPREIAEARNILATGNAEGET